MVKKYKHLFLYLLLLLVGVLIGKFWLGSPESAQPQVEEMHEHSEETIWTCSMHPQIRQNEPGKCPLCGMDLTPLASETDAGTDPSSISLSPYAMKLAEVQTQTVGLASNARQARLNGKIVTDERLTKTQVSHLNGRIERLMVNFTGEYIQAGQVLAYVYSPELSTAQQELLEAYSVAGQNPDLVISAKEKLRNWKLSEKQIEQIIREKTIQEQFPILAQSSGVVTEKRVNVGDYVNIGTPLYQVSDLSQVWAMIDIYETDLAWIKKNMPVTLEIRALSGQTFSGKIDFIDPTIDPSTRIARGRIVLSNALGLLKPEMFLSALVQAQNQAQALTIPASAVLWTGERSVVYVKTAEGTNTHFQLRNITVGALSGESYPVLQGLEAGEEVVVNGTFAVDAAAQLAGKPSMMSPKEVPATVTTTPEKKAKALSLSKEESAEALPLLKSYLEIKTALSGDDFDQAKKAAAQWMSIWEKKKNQLPEAFKSSFPASAAHIHHASDIEGLRKGFLPFSQWMIQVAEALNKPHSTLYVQFCPMANEDKGGYWLSDSEEILNPYFGASMLSCGEVSKEIKTP